MVAPRSIYHGKQKEAYPHSKVKKYIYPFFCRQSGSPEKTPKSGLIGGVILLGHYNRQVHILLLSMLGWYPLKTESWLCGLPPSLPTALPSGNGDTHSLPAPCSPALYVYVYQPIPFHPGSPTPVPLPRHIQIVRNLCKGFFTCMQIQQTVFASQIISDKSRPHNLVLLDPIGTS